jgi:hypothetical protein
MTTQPQPQQEEMDRGDRSVVTFNLIYRHRGPGRKYSACGKKVTVRLEATTADLLAQWQNGVQLNEQAKERWRQISRNMGLDPADYEQTIGTGRPAHSRWVHGVPVEFKDPEVSSIVPGGGDTGGDATSAGHHRINPQIEKVIPRTQMTLRPKQAESIRSPLV